MEYEGFKLKGVIFDKKYLLERECFSFKTEFGSKYEFIIHDIGYNALTIAGFFKYPDIIHSAGKIENQLHELIEDRATNPVSLANVADKRKYYLYGEKIYVNVDNGEYTFEITGIGPYAIKISMDITYDEIATSNKPLEVILKDFIENIYASKFNDRELTRKIDKQWQNELEEKRKVEEEIAQDKAWKRQKQKELEEFLKL